MRSIPPWAALAAVLLFVYPKAFAENEPPVINPHEKPALMLARTFQDGMDPAGWWISEKLDGVRGFWTGETMVSRSGNVIPVPDWFTAGFPRFPLDGELWIGRGRFSELTGLLRKADPADGWSRVGYYVFDAPSENSPFEHRLDKARRWFDDHPASRVHVLHQERCEGRSHLRYRLAEVEKEGGEGLMLRRPGSPYSPGRSPDLLKVKSFLDAEARVVEHIGGTGKFRGKMGALRVVLENGVRFSIGTGFSDRDRENPPPVGSTVTFRYKELNPSGIPRFASFMRVRDDL